VIEAYVGLGSNMGDRMGNLRSALLRLAREPGFRVRAVSRVWDPAPMGPPQPRFLNAAAQIDTLLSPRATLRRPLISPCAAGCSAPRRALVGRVGS
jgi:2-amino-4-hydroxy-6-hydroxymethyldihydropteridine diphosphokinase